MYPYPILKIAGQPVLYLYDLFLALGVIVALIVSDSLARKREFSVRLQKISVISAVCAVVFGYFSAVLFQAAYNCLGGEKFVVAEDTGATFYGGLIGGAIVFLLVWFVFGKKEASERFSDIADIAAVCIPLAHALGRIGCFFAGCCYGKPSETFGVYMAMAGEKVVPVQLFESAFLFALFFVTLKLFRKGKSPLLSVYLVVYGVWRFFIEYARTDERGASPIGFLTPSQLTAIILIFVGVVYFIVVKIKKDKKRSFER